VIGSSGDLDVGVDHVLQQRICSTHELLARNVEVTRWPDHPDDPISKFIQVGKESCMARTPGTYAIFDTTEGTIVCRLFEKEAPKTVQNFIELAEGRRNWQDRMSGKKGPGPLYDGTIFHRVIPNFMIQGGDPSGTGMGGPGYQFEDETKGSPHKFDKPGKLAMANAGPNTNGSQFFITVAATTWLTGNHTIFGEVVEGQDIVDKIANLPRNRQDKPLKDVKLNSVKVEKSS
jgi:peptidyl-prolyl cis-trans isomerase A (cyclophilin A)